MLDESNIIVLADESIARRDHVIGKETRFYILTIKINNHHYVVKLFEKEQLINSIKVDDRLDLAKREGVKLLVDQFADTSINDVSMVHYKEDRPRPWVKDSEVVLKQLFNFKRSNPLEQIDMNKLHRVLADFTAYRKRDENHYLSNERTYKLEILNAIGDILHRIKDDPESAKENLLNLVKSKQSDSKLIRNFDNLLSASYGYAQRDDFRVLLENINSKQFTELFQDLFEYGVTVEVRTNFNQEYKKLFDQGKMSPAKKSAAGITLHFLAILLVANDINQYTLYKPTEYQNFMDYLGIKYSNDILENYQLYNQFAQYVLKFSQQNNYHVKDLIDTHNVIYMFSQYDEVFSNRENPASNKGDLTMTKQEPSNLILFGPPGTGKTYHSINKCLEILEQEIDRDILINPNLREEAIIRFNKHRENKQVMFCTFHQSYSYEEFVEGIRYDIESKNYEVKDGIFKVMCDIARTTASEPKSSYHFNEKETQFFKMSLGNSRDNNDDIYDFCIENSLVSLGWGGEVDYSSCESKDDIRRDFRQKYPDAGSFDVDAMERFKHWMRKDDIVIISHGNHKVRAIGKVTGDYFYDENSPIEYNHFRKVEWLFISMDVMIPVAVVMKEKVFSQQTIYMFLNADLNMENLQDLLSNSAEKHEPQFVLIIDEINRGNISKIFGELITLIEADKRIGSQNETWVTLPYSGKQFAIPRNLHIIGTMNTADRSIAILDTALRRRFDFIEMMPEHTLLPIDVEGINIRLILQTINERIEYLYDRDHMIGHAYFLTKQASIQYYIQVMKQRIIPLLQEYFYDNWEMIELVLGGSGKGNDSSFFLNRMDISTDNLFNHTKTNKLTDQNKRRYLINPAPTKEALINICRSLIQDEE